MSPGVAETAYCVVAQARSIHLGCSFVRRYLVRSAGGAGSSTVTHAAGHTLASYKVHRKFFSDRQHLPPVWQPCWRSRSRSDSASVRYCLQRDEDANLRLMEENASLRSWMEDPKSPADFERLLLVNGNSAAVWIRQVQPVSRPDNTGCLDYSGQLPHGVHCLRLASQVLLWSQLRWFSRCSHSSERSHNSLWGSSLFREPANPSR